MTGKPPETVKTERARRRRSLIEQSSLTSKTFRPVVPVSKRIKASSSCQPKIVAADLRQGSLLTLGSYLDKHHGIPDAIVADALKALLSGSSKESEYRIAIVRHPDLPPDRGRPKRKSAPIPSQRDHEISVLADKLQRDGLQEQIAVEDTAAYFGLGKSTVRQARKRVRDFQCAERARAEATEALLARRSMALETLRRNSGQD